MSRTYTFDEIKQTLKDAGLNSAARHRVYCNLPAMPPKRISFAAPGCRVYVKDAGGDFNEGVLAACTIDEFGEADPVLTIWMHERGAFGASGSKFRVTCEQFRASDHKVFSDPRLAIPVMGVTRGTITETIANPDA